MASFLNSLWSNKQSKLLFFDFDTMSKAEMRQKVIAIKEAKKVKTNNLKVSPERFIILRLFVVVKI